MWDSVREIIVVNTRAGQGRLRPISRQERGGAGWGRGAEYWSRSQKTWVLSTTLLLQLLWPMSSSMTWLLRTQEREEIQ